MIHQPSGGAQGQATDIHIAAEHILKMRQRLNKILAERCNQPIDKIAADTERDNWMDAEAAKAYGIIDHIMEKRA
jgi:ATP-dependent Clp protease protease subunit